MENNIGGIHKHPPISLCDPFQELCDTDSSLKQMLLGMLNMRWKFGNRKLKIHTSIEVYYGSRPSVLHSFIIFHSLIRPENQVSINRKRLT